MCQHWLELICNRDVKFPCPSCKTCLFASSLTSQQHTTTTITTTTTTAAADDDDDNELCNSRLFPYCTENCLQHRRSNGQDAIMCKSCATHLALNTCNMSCAIWYKRAAHLLNLIRVEIAFTVTSALFHWLKPMASKGGVVYEAFSDYSDHENPLHTHTYTHTHMCVCAHTRTFMLICAHPKKYTQMHTDTNAHTCMTSQTVIPEAAMPLTVWWLNGQMCKTLAGKSSSFRIK